MTMSDQSRIFTLGPADPKAGWRAKAYAALSAMLGLITLAATFGLIPAIQGAVLTNIVEGVIGLLGAGGLAVAAAKTRQQVGNGTFDRAPEPAPERNAFDALGQLQTQVNSAVDQAQTKVTEGVAAIQGAASLLPGGSFVADAVLNGPVGDLIKAVQAVRDR